MQFLNQLIEFIGNNPLLVTAFVVVLTLLIITEGRKAGQVLGSQQATQLINKENALIVDVRPKKDFAAGHIVDSRNIPADQLAKRMSELEKHKEQPILLVCANGQHAGPCAKQLKAAGFTKVNRLSGGVNGWRADNLPVVK
ncbi:MAG: rhodanese-like domain-containing protein [Gammaproteobacteria bacterium]|nr:rhodanese-like domain-containing protein [Gammaproteobacteria bacterium]